MKRLRIQFLLLAMLAIAPTAATGPRAAMGQDEVGIGEPSTLPVLPPVDNTEDSAAVNQALDQPMPPFQFSGQLSDGFGQLSALSNVHIQATQSVWDVLPYGPSTMLRTNMRNVTARQAIERIARKLGLVYSVDANGVTLTPLPALLRIGRRASFEDLALMDLLSGAPATLPPSITVHDLIRVVDRRLYYLHSPFAVEDRALDDRTEEQELAIPRNATLLDALEELPQQTDATWCPSGNSLMFMKKIDAVRMMLARRVDLQIEGQNIEQVLSELSDKSGVPFVYSPGALQRVPPEYRRVNLTLRYATVRQALSIISGQTGLMFEPTEDGVKVTAP